MYPPKKFPGISWFHILRELLFFLVIFLLVLSVQTLFLPAQAVKNSMDAYQPGFVAETGASALIAESPHFRLVAYEHYASKQAGTAFLDMAETRYPDLCAYLDLPVEETPVSIYVVPSCEISSGGINSLTLQTCNNTLGSEFSSLFVHELTHTLLRSRQTVFTSSFLSEGLAEATATGFNWGMNIPDERAVHLLETLRAGGLLPLEDLRTGISASKYNTLSGLEYAQAGSFVGYLLRNYGDERFWEQYTTGADYQEVYGVTLAELEQGWLRSLEFQNLGLAAALAVAGIGVLGMFAGSIRGKFHFLLPCFAWLAFLFWSLLLGTAYAASLVYVLLYQVSQFASAPLSLFQPLWVPAGILLAGLLGALVTRRRERLGRLLLWLVGAGTLVGFLLLPALLLFLV